MMKLLIVAALLCVVTSQMLGFGKDRLKVAYEHKRNSLMASEDNGCPNTETLYYKDAVKDNFAPVDKQTKWENEGQRFFVNRQFWGGPGAPIFVFIGGEGEEACGRLEEGNLYMYQLAKEHNAMMIDVEHRFYGRSLPTTDVSTENLGLLTSDQALADLARVINYVKKDLFNTPHSKVITTGGSYPGNLSGWFRLKYPSVTHGSIASSAPVRAKANFYEYMEVVGEAMLYFGGQECYDSFEEAANMVTKLANEGPGSDGMKQLETDFQTCDPIENELDLATFESNVMGTAQGVVQYNNEVPGQPTVADYCSAMAAKNDDGSKVCPYKTLAKLMANQREASGAKCEDVSYKNTVDYLANTKAEFPTNAARSWVYQTCNEFGYYQTSDSVNQPFHSFKPLSGLTYSRKMCFDAYNGWTSDPATEFTNEKYGGTAVEATNVVWTSGSIDPWHALGVTNYSQPLPLYPSEIPVYILGTAHCNDLKAPKDTDPAPLTEAREIVSKKISQWLQ